MDLQMPTGSNGSTTSSPDESLPNESSPDESLPNESSSNQAPSNEELRTALSDNTYADNTEETAETDSRETGQEISKSQRKREASAITELARQISELPQTDFDDLPMETSARDAITALRKITQFGARKRQLHYAGKILRKSDTEPLVAALAARKSLTDSKNQHFHALEKLRDELTGSDGDQALTDLISQHPDIAHQRLRQLVRKSRLEQERQQPPRSSRELFRLLREMLDPPSE